MCLLLKSSVLLLVLNIISMMALESSALSALFVETLLGQGKGPKIQKVFEESKKWVKKRDVFCRHVVKNMFLKNILCFWSLVYMEINRVHNLGMVGIISKTSYYLIDLQWVNSWSWREFNLFFVGSNCTKMFKPIL